MIMSRHLIRIAAGLLAAAVVLLVSTQGTATAYPINPDSTPAQATVASLERPEVGEVPYADIQADALTRSGAIDPVIQTDEGAGFGPWAWAALGTVILALIGAAFVVSRRPAQERRRGHRVRAR